MKNYDGPEYTEAKLAADEAWEVDDGYPVDDYWWFGFVDGYKAHQARAAGR